MPEEKKKVKRLGKAAGEFNISISTAFNCLKKKYSELEENPNAKLTEEMYDLLLETFSAEKLVKAEADKIDIGTYNSKKTSKKASASEEPEKPKAKAVEEEKKEEEPASTLIIKDLNPEKPTHVEMAAPKVIGKIDLGNAKSSKPAQPEKEQVKEVPAETPEKPVEEVVAPTAPETPKVEEAPVKTESEKTEHLGPKVVDKIDLSQLNKKSTKETKVEKKDVPNEKKEEKKEETQKPAEVKVAQPEEKKEVEVIKTEVAKLTGPKVLGKIELPVEKPKETKKEERRPNAGNNAAGAKKKKRKRISTPANVKPNNFKEAKKEKEEPEKVEISTEDIQRRIKETKQRLEPTGKSKAAKRRKEKRQLIHERIEEQQIQEIENQKILKVTEFLTASELATMMNIPVNNIIATCMSIGLFVSINQRLDAETISMLAEEFGYQIEFIDADADESENAELQDAPEDLIPRHPIITVMGHVDHGKTSLLDYIRKTNVIAGEAGGITQHIGAYEVTLADGRRITFLDTPGHEAFTAMRARGAKITDLCIIVIAADDAVMPQTTEAINHAQAAGVPMVFAITKIDKANANPDRIREQLANMNILVEDWGGSYQCQEIDAKHGVNVNELLEKVLLEADMLELKANPNRLGLGAVIESSLDKGRGYIAKVLIQNGTLRIGDPILAGSCFGKVKAMFNERNQPIKSAGPATPVLLLGLNGAPQAGDTFKVCESEQEARSIASKRARLAREMGLRTQKHITLEEIGRRIAIGDFKELNIIVKGDVDGSVEALSGELLKLSTEQVQVNVIHKSVGAVTETDVMLATASNALIVAFQVRPTAGARKTAEAEQIDIRTYSIIYTAINEIKDAIAGMHAPEIREKVVCNIEIREVFHISKVGNIAGCMVLDGKLQRSTRIRLIRDGIVIYTGKLGSLRRFKDDVKEVVSGQDCGLNIDGCNDIKVGDIIEGYEEYEVAYNANNK